MTNNNNLVQEIGLIIISVAIVAGAVILLVLGKIDYAGCAGLIASVVALWGANSLYKAPSPSQQQQLGAQQQQLSAQQQNLQQLLAYALNLLPGLLQSIGQPAQPPVAPPQPAQTAQPVQPAVSPVIPARPSLAHPGASNVGVQQQQFRPQPVNIPEVSMPLAAMPKP